MRVIAAWKSACQLQVDMTLIANKTAAHHLQARASKAWPRQYLSSSCTFEPTIPNYPNADIHHAVLCDYVLP
ncbi:hypothetical protein HZ326_13711 [Fusarium oxysporum f. sp. albedinis]|nr:hypothetical protein HZ326_13711 [Fusarium oxysporum f. sp. albedinis]